MSTIASNKITSAGRLVNDELANKLINCRQINPISQLNPTGPLNQINAINHTHTNRSQQSTNHQQAIDRPSVRKASLEPGKSQEDDKSAKKSHLHHLYQLRKLQQQHQRQAGLHDQLEEQSDASCPDQNSDNNSTTGNNTSCNNHNPIAAATHHQNDTHNNSHPNIAQDSVIPCDRTHNGAHSNNKRTPDSSKRQQPPSGPHLAPPPPPPPPPPPATWLAAAVSTSFAAPPAAPTQIAQKLACPSHTDSTEAMAPSSRSSFARDSSAPSVHSSSQQHIIGHQRVPSSGSRQHGPYHTNTNTQPINHHIQQQQFMPAHMPARGSPGQHHRDNLFGQQPVRDRLEHSHQLGTNYQRGSQPRQAVGSVTNAAGPAVHTGRQIMAANHSAAAAPQFGGELVPACRSMQPHVGHLAHHSHHFHNHHSHHNHVVGHSGQCKHRRPMSQQHVMHTTGCCRLAGETTSRAVMSCSKSDNQSEISAACAHRHNNNNSNNNNSNLRMQHQPSQRQQLDVMTTTTNKSKVSSRSNKTSHLSNQNDEPDDDSVDGELDDNNDTNNNDHDHDIDDSSSANEDDRVDNVNVDDIDANDNTIRQAPVRRHNSHRNDATTQKRQQHQQQHLNSSKNELIDEQHQLCSVNRPHHTKRQLIREAAIVATTTTTTAAPTTATVAAAARGSLQQVRQVTGNKHNKHNQNNGNIIRTKQPHKHYLLEGACGNSNNKLFAGHNNNNNSSSSNNNSQVHNSQPSQSHNASHHKGFNARFASQLYLLLHVSITLSLIYYSDLGGSPANYSAPGLHKSLLREANYEIVLASSNQHPVRVAPNYLPAPSLLVGGRLPAAAPQTITMSQSSPQTTTIKLDKRPAISSVVKSSIWSPAPSDANHSSQQQHTTPGQKSRHNRSLVTGPSNRLDGEQQQQQQLVQLLSNPFYSKNLIHYYISYLLCTSSLLLILYRFCVAGKSKCNSKLLGADTGRRRGATKCDKRLYAKPAPKLDAPLGPGDRWGSCHRCQSKLDYAPVLLGSVTLGLIQLTVIGLEIAKFINDKHVYLPILKFIFVFFVMQFILARVSNTSKSDNLANFALAHLLATQVSLWLMKLNHVNDQYQQTANRWHASFLDADLLIKINGSSATIMDHMGSSAHLPVGPTHQNGHNQHAGDSYQFGVRPAVTTTPATLTESTSNGDSDNERIVLQNNSGKTPIYMTSTFTKQLAQQGNNNNNNNGNSSANNQAQPELAANKVWSVDDGDKPAKQYDRSRPMEQSKSNQQPNNIVGDIIISGANLTANANNKTTNANLLNLDVTSMIMDKILKGTNQLSLAQDGLPPPPPVTQPARQLIEPSRGSGAESSPGKSGDNGGNNRNNNIDTARDGSGATLGASVSVSEPGSTTRRPQTTQSPVRVTADVDTHTTTPSKPQTMASTSQQQQQQQLPKPSSSSMSPRQQQPPLPKPVITTTSLDENNRIINVTVRNGGPQHQPAGPRDPAGSARAGDAQDGRRKTRDRSAAPITINKHTILVPDNSQIVAKKGPAPKQAHGQWQRAPPKHQSTQHADARSHRSGPPGVLAPGKRAPANSSFGVPAASRSAKNAPGPKKLESPYSLPTSSDLGSHYKQQQQHSIPATSGSYAGDAGRPHGRPAQTSATDADEPADSEHVSESPASFSSEMEGDTRDTDDNPESSDGEPDARLQPSEGSGFSSELDIPDESFMFNEASTVRETLAVAPYSLTVPRQLINGGSISERLINGRLVDGRQWHNDTVASHLPWATGRSAPAHAGSLRARRHEQQQQSALLRSPAGTGDGLPLANVSANGAPHNTFADLLMPFVHHYHILIIAILFNLWINNRRSVALAPSANASPAHCAPASSRVRYHAGARPTVDSVGSSSCDAKTALRSPSTDSSAISSFILVELDGDKRRTRSKMRSHSLESLNSSAYYDPEPANVAQSGQTNWHKDPIRLNREGKIKRHSTKRIVTSSAKKNCHFLGARSSSMSLLSTTSSTQPMADTLRLDLLQSPAYASGSLSLSRRPGPKSKSIKGFFVGMLVLSSSFIVLLLKNEIVTMTTHSVIQFICVIITVIALVIHWRKKRARRRKLGLYERQPLGPVDMEASPGQIMQFVDHNDRAIASGNYFYRQPYSLMREQLKERQSSTIRAFMNSHLVVAEQQHHRRAQGKHWKKNADSNGHNAQSNALTECQLSIDFMSYLFLLSSYYCGLSVSLESYYKLTTLLVTNGSTSASIMLSYSLINAAFIHTIMIFKGLMLIVQVTLQSLLIRISCINSIETKQIFAFLIFTNLSLWILEVSDQGVPWASYDPATTAATATADRGLKAIQHNPRNIFSMLVTLTRFYQALVFMQHWMKTR